MSALRSRVAPLACAAALALLAGSGCQHRILSLGHSMPGDYAVALFRYELERCPLPGFELPPLKRDKEERIEAGYYDGPYCHAYTKYSFDSRHGISYRETVPAYVRLDVGAESCQLDVALPTARTDEATALHPYADIVARLVTDASGATPKIPSKMTTFDSHREFARWCERRIVERLRSTTHKIFQR